MMPLSTKLTGIRPIFGRTAFAVRALTTSPTPTAEKKSTSSLPAPSKSGGSEVVPVEDPDHSVATLSVDELRARDYEDMRPTGEVLIYEGPERDLVNFPRVQIPLYGGRTRLGFIPEEWFDFFYKKTGVSGPYVFGIGLVTTLLSKELWVMEHEFPLIPPMIFLSWIAVKKLGPGLAKALDKHIDDGEEAFIQLQEGNIKRIQDTINSEEKSQWMAKGQSSLFEAKRENVQLQLEAEYRRRLMEVYKDIKKRLDYQIEIQNTRRRVEQRHMINWITNNVINSIDEQQENKNIDQCISNLKRLATA